jgi:prolipoprotein diacylglyceryltransferase
VEITKKLVGITRSTGDAFAVAVPLSLGVGRIACLLGGCCYGTASQVAWAVHLAGSSRHPVQLYEAALDVALAAMIYRVREQPRREGDLFKLSLLGYAAIRVVLDPFRGDARVWLGPVSAVQITCLLAGVVLLWALRRAPRTIHA